MPDQSTGVASTDPYDLARFVKAQSDVYDRALTEIRAGRKQSHWMWFVFPQLDGLGSSSTARQFSIKSLAEAEAYLRHPVLGSRLVQCAEAAIALDGVSAEEIFGSIDGKKLRSSATLFSRVSAAGSVFHRLLDRFHDGEPDPRTLTLLELSPQ